MAKILTALGLEEWDCEKCGERLHADSGDVEETLTELGGEPFNGMSISCTCGAEYSLEMIIRATRIDADDEEDDDDE